MPANILNLPYYTIMSVKESEHDYHISAETSSPDKTCIHCFSTNTLGGGRQEILIKDLPMHGKRVGIYVQARRFRCLNCGKTHTERLPYVTEGQRMTGRLIRWIGQQSINRTFTSIANDVGISEGSVRLIFNDYVTELEKKADFQTPEWMGIDEIHIIKKPRCVISNVESNTVVDMLVNRDKPLIINYLMRIRDRHRIKCVTMDMWQPYKDAVYSCLPQAFIVVDKFHVLRMANAALETVRKGIREGLTPKQRRGLMHDRFILLKRKPELNPMQHVTLESWTRNFPILGEAYRAKEEFFRVYDSMTIPDAHTAYSSWKDDCLTPSIAEAFKPLTTAMANWNTEIFNYFEHPVTNSYTESLNGLIRVINRCGRGYSFEALRAKILFSAGAHKIVRPKFERRSISNMYDFMVFTKTTPSTVREEKAINYGTDISTLERLLEEEKL